MNFEEKKILLRNAIDGEMRRVVSGYGLEGYPELTNMLAYHLGWEGEGAGPKAQGKRIRPLLLLLSCGAAGGDWEKALAASASVELIHNFSLIHDDIQDQSNLRHGRPTVWAKWGVPQAINAGDLMFTLANSAMLNLDEKNNNEITVEAVSILQRTCVELTRGQYLDMSYETRDEITPDAYWSMVSGKTAALLACCTEIGALVSGVDFNRRNLFKKYGYALGMAFQAWDDLLGIWGNTVLTGKSNESDLVSGKKTLPVVYGLMQQGKFSKRWRAGNICASEIGELSEILEEEGAKAYTIEMAEFYSADAINALNLAADDNQDHHILLEMTDMLLRRQH